jgi:hypothetical protein
VTARGHRTGNGPVSVYCTVPYSESVYLMPGVCLVSKGTKFSGAARTVCTTVLLYIKCKTTGESKDTVSAVCTVPLPVR